MFTEFGFSCRDAVTSAVQALFRTDRMRVYTCNDVIGVEVCEMILNFSFRTLSYCRLEVRSRMCLPLHVALLKAAAWDIIQPLLLSRVVSLK